MLQKLENPTFYFIGVDTKKSEIMKLFPLSVGELGFPVKGINVLELNAQKGYDVMALALFL